MITLDIIQTTEPSCSRGVSEAITGLDSSFPRSDESIISRVRQRVADGARVVVGLSGGKDSVSVCLLLQELDIPFTAVFADTGWESKLTYRYVQWFADHRHIDLVMVDADGRTLLDVCRHKGCFPKKKRRFCTEELKENPIAAHIAELKAQGSDVISVAGIRAAESAQRAAMAVWNDDDPRFNCDTWHPIFDWSYDDTIAMHHRHNCKPNPLYLLGASRVGCFPCVFEKKAGLRIVSVLEPERIGDIRQAEADIDADIRAKKGEAYEERNYPTSTMFWLSIHGQNRPALIDDVIQRAWTPANRKERELLDDGTLRGQITAAENRWGFSIDLGDIDLEPSTDPGAIHADYSHRYRTNAELKAEKNTQRTLF